MKRFRLTLMMAVALLATSFIASCDVHDDNQSPVFPTALVTVKPVDADSFYMQLDEETTLKPVNMKGSPYGSDEVRALVSYTETNDDPTPYDKAVRMSQMEKILTKQTVVRGDSDEDFGNDPVEIVDDWVTIVEDGYLTLRFRTISSNTGQLHRVSLVAENRENPYEVRFCHDANGDIRGDMVDGLVAFRLNTLPDTEGKTVKLILKWDSFSGEKQAEFDYCTRRDTPASGSAVVIKPTLRVK